MARRAKTPEEEKLEGRKSQAKSRALAKPAHIDQLPESIPDYLPDTAATAYVEIVRHLNDLGIGAACDLALVESLALAVGTMRDCAAILRTDGLVIVDDRGVARKNPCASIMNAQIAQVRQIAPKLGLSPTARAGMTIKKPAGAHDDPIMAEFGHWLED